MDKLKIIFIAMLMVVTLFGSISFAAITEQQGEDVAAFAKKFIEENMDTIMSIGNSYDTRKYAKDNLGNSEPVN